MKQNYTLQNKAFTNTTKSNTKALRQQQSEYLRLKNKFNKLMNDDYNSQPQQVQTIGNKLSEQQIKLKQQQIIFDKQMAVTLKSIKQCEYKRIHSLRDALTNWSAFITNLWANRMYDVRSLTQSVSAINVQNDLQLYMQSALQKDRETVVSKTGSLFDTYFRRRRVSTPSASATKPQQSNLSK